MNKPVIPNSALILYSKGWISFIRKHPDWTIIDIMKEIVRMCDYIPSKDPTYQVINLYSGIINFLNKWNTDNPEKYVNIPVSARSIYNWEYEVERTRAIYVYKSREEAIIRTILSELSMLDIREFDVMQLEYNKKNQYCIASVQWDKGMTYKTMNWKFKKTFRS